MRLCIATCWEDDYLHRLAALSGPDAKVYEVFGSLARSIVGSGRNAELVPDVTPERVQQHVRLARSLGIKFNYLLNASTLGGLELTASGRAQLADHIRWVRDLGVDSVTIAVPLLLELTREVAPELELVVSTIAHVDSVRAAKFHEAAGAHRITLSLMANRDFQLLRELRRGTKCELEVLANEMCLYQCPWRTEHYVIMGQASRPGSRSPAGDHCQLKCTAARLALPAELVKSRFIRPEDVARYEEIGIDLIKLAGRGAPARALLARAEAYLSRRYDGDFIDISDLGLHVPEGAERPQLQMDNRALDGMLDRIAAVDCARMCGLGCRVCEDIAAKAVRLGDHRSLDEALARESHGWVKTDSQPGADAGSPDGSGHERG